MTATISEDDLEIRLAFVRAHSAGPQAGLFGPGSASWSVNREAAIFLGAGRALLLQLAHPWVAAAIAEHSHVVADPIGRFHRTFTTMFAMVFGSTDQALTAARRLHRRHAGIAGAMPRAAGPFAQGSRYWANEPSALRWVHATLVESALIAHDLALAPLSGDERDRCYAESRTIAGLFGLAPESLPRDWDEFRAYVDAMLDSDTLTVIPEARMIADAVLKGHNPFLRPPAWYMAMTAATLPPRLRLAYGLTYDADERRAAQSAVAWIRRLYPRLPERLRFVGPYQEAVARLSGKPRPDVLNRWINRFWIGHASLADVFADPAAERE